MWTQKREKIQETRNCRQGSACRNLATKTQLQSQTKTNQVKHPVQYVQYDTIQQYKKISNATHTYHANTNEYEGRYSEIWRQRKQCTDEGITTTTCMTSTTASQERRLAYNQHKKALRYLMFFKEKRDGSIKARGCADGCSQREIHY